MPTPRRLRRFLPAGIAVSVIALSACSGDSTIPTAGPQPDPAPSTWGDVQPLQECVGDPLPAMGDNHDFDTVQVHTDGLVACVIRVEEGTVGDDAHEWQVGQDSIEVTMTLFNEGPSQVVLPYGPTGLLRFGSDQPVEPVTRGGLPEIPERLTAGQGFTGTFVFMVPGEPREDLVINYGPFSWWSIPDRDDPRAHDPAADDEPTP